jgi:hypothetical protein
MQSRRVVAVVVLTVVVVVAQPPVVHASQQLVKLVSQAVPPRGGLQRPAPTIRQRVPPAAVVRQQVVVPARPQVERDAQRMTEARHAARRLPAATRSRTTPEAQRTYSACVVKGLGQTQNAST